MASAAPTPPEDVPARFRVDLEGERLLGLYHVEEKLAEGGMGTLYLATDEGLGRKVVVKVPHARFLAEPGFRARMAREVEGLVRLEHPHVVRILARGEHEDVPFFVLQYLGGGSLEDRMRAAAEGRLDPEAVATWLPTVARTLDYVHEQGVVHRDVKPANVLFDDQGNVFLSDFGVAKSLGAGEAGLTGTGIGIGSPRYMAPEQVRGDDVGPAADQYGLGATVYEVLAGTAPHGDLTAVDLLMKKIQAPARPLRVLAPHVPGPAAAAVDRALLRDPGARHESCRAFAEAFRAGLLAPSALPPAARSTPWGGRRRTAWAVGALAVAALAGILFLVQSPSPRPTSSPAASPAPPGSPLFTLLEPGAEPREALRYVPRAGSRERIVMTTRAVVRSGTTGTEHGTPPWVMEADVFVVAVEAGRIRFRWVTTACRAGLEDGAVSERLAPDFASLVGLSFAGTTDDRGRVSDVTVAGQENLTPLAQQLLQGLQVAIREFLVPFPEEPVGLGARWEVVRLGTNAGMRSIQTTTYELREREGYVVKLLARTLLAAPPDQAITAPEALGAMTGRLESLQGQARTEIRHDVTQLVPRASETTTQASFAFLDGTGADARRVEGSFETNSLMERR